jgi:hypothetical protein
MAWSISSCFLVMSSLLSHYIQLTKIEAVFCTLKTELNVRYIFHRTQRHVGIRLLIAFWFTACR